MPGTLFYITQHHTAQCHGEVFVDAVHGNTTHIRFVSIDIEAPIIMGHNHVVIDINQVRRLLEDFGQLMSHRTPGRGIRTMYFCHHGLQHWWSWGHFHNSKFRVDVLEQLAHFLPRLHGNLMTAALAMMLIHKLHLYFGLPGLLAQIVMPDHAIEIERLGGSHVHLHRSHFRQLSHQVGNLIRPVCGFRQRRTFRHIQHDGIFRLIVQRQHFDHDQFEIEHAAHEQEHGPHAQTEHACLARILNHGRENAAEHFLQLFSFFVLALFSNSKIFHGWSENRVNCQPGRKHKGCKQRDHHGDGSQSRDGHHIRSHHAGHESHGQQSTDDGQGCQNSGISHLSHRIHGGFCIGCPLFQPTPVNVFHHHDGIIYKNSDGKNQGKQRHSINSKAQHPGAKHCKQKHHGYYQQHYQSGFQGTESPPNQHEYKECCHKQLENQCADFVVSRFTVITGYADLDIAGNQTPLQFFDTLHDFIGNRHAIGTLFLGNGNSYRWNAFRQIWVFSRCTSVISHHALGIFRPLTDNGHITHIHGHPVVATHFEMIDIISCLQKLASNDGEMGACRLNIPCLLLCICLLNRLRHLPQADAITRQTRRQYFNRHLFGTTAYHKTFSCIGNFLDGLQHGQCQTAQLAVVDVWNTIAVVILVRPQCQGNHGNIINALCLNQWRRYPVGNFVHIRGKLFIHLDQRRLHVLPHLELYGHHASPSLRDGIDMFYTLNFPHHAFQGLYRQGSDLFHWRTWILHKQIDQGYRYLRVFLTRRHHQTRQTQKEHG